MTICKRQDNKSVFTTLKCFITDKTKNLQSSYCDHSCTLIMFTRIKVLEKKTYIVAALQN